MTIMYIHGYGSNSNATKGRLLRSMKPECRVVSPTFDYDHSTPWQIQQQIRDVVASENVSMMVGSSFGGYHTLCATTFFHGTVWAINPVHNVADTIRRIVMNRAQPKEAVDQFIAMYERFDDEVFRQLSQLNRSGQWPGDTSLNFALSTDDELLGDHRPLLELFPTHSQVVWKDHCGHRFLRFKELAELL